MMQHFETHPSVVVLPPSICTYITTYHQDYSQAMAISDYTMTRGENGSVTSTKVLAPFLEPKFDPADFLNAALPSWSPAGSGTSLTEINTQTQTIVSQLNAQLTRLMSSLTQLTDDILRSGGRLAYEVEMLRGDTTSLADVLVDDLRDEIQKFLPQGVKLHAEAEAQVTNGAAEEENATTSMPDYIVKLNTLAVVRDRYVGSNAQRSLD
jgi:hypothetical protein